MKAPCCQSLIFFKLEIGITFLETIVQAKENMSLGSLWPDSNPLHTITSTFENIYCRNSWKLILLNEENTIKCESESEVAQSCLTLHDPMDCSLPGSSVHGILQAWILEWLMIPSPGKPPHPEIKPGSPTFQADSLPSQLPGKRMHKQSTDDF